MNTTISTQKGFVILFAIVVSAIIMMIGAGIFSIAFKETVLSSTANESQVALFAADTGMECSLYHEFTNRPIDAPTPIDVDCFGIAIKPDPTGGSKNYSFIFDLEGTPSCGFVSVIHKVSSPLPSAEDQDPEPIGTHIISRGYNVCINQKPDLSSPFLVERRLEAWYPTGVVETP